MSNPDTLRNLERILCQIDKHEDQETLHNVEVSQAKTQLKLLREELNSVKEDLRKTHLERSKHLDSIGGFEEKINCLEKEVKDLKADIAEKKSAHEALIMRANNASLENQELKSTYIAHLDVRVHALLSNYGEVLGKEATDEILKVFHSKEFPANACSIGIGVAGVTKQDEHLPDQISEVDEASHKLYNALEKKCSEQAARIQDLETSLQTFNSTIKDDQPDCQEKEEVLHRLESLHENLAEMNNYADHLETIIKTCLSCQSKLSDQEAVSQSQEDPKC